MTTLLIEDTLARAVQHGIPLEADPFGALAAKLFADPPEVLDLLRAWQDDGRLREISAVLDAAALGYQSALVTGKVPEDRLEHAVACVNACPTVSHNYLRDHAYNLWFTIAVPPRIGLGPAIERLSSEAEVTFHPLPARRTFKLQVCFALDGSGNDSAPGKEAPPRPPIEVTPHDERLFRALQRPLPLEPDPFGLLAGQDGLEREELLSFARRQHGGALRRYCATFHHRRLGVQGNAMVVWAVPPHRIEQVGRLLASAPQTSHCYARDPLADFPYTLYSMLHAPDERGLLALVADLAQRAGVAELRILTSLRQFQKRRLRYFLPELDAWWAA